MILYTVFAHQLPLFHNSSSFLLADFFFLVVVVQLLLRLLVVRWFPATIQTICCRFCCGHIKPVASPPPLVGSSSTTRL
jgi:hypothetical protein